MKSFLPRLFIAFFLFTSFLFLHNTVYAAIPTTTPIPTVITPTVPPGSIVPTNPPDGTWVSDSEVTFVGKAGARAGAFLDWSLQDYKWSSGSATLSSFWVTIRNIIYSFLLLFVIITAFVLIITRGQNITFMQFIPRFILIIILITFSFALIQLLYQIADIFQGFFLRKADGTLMSQKDLFYIGFNYKTFVGYRISGFINDESTFVSLLLIRLTTVTYYVMASILLLRKVLLWFFIIVSPIFPLLLLFSNIRNTAKVWFGEFLRWLLYAPIFSLLLSGLVTLWQSPQLPLKFDFSAVSNPQNIVYPTAVNILLGGPGQIVSTTNSINLPDTFALYMVSLIMLWVVILLPFLLLQIFLDYFTTLSLSDTWSIQKMMQTRFPFLEKFPQAAGIKNTYQQNTVSAAAPFLQKGPIDDVIKNYSSIRRNTTAMPYVSQWQNPINANPRGKSDVSLFGLTDFKVPSMRDIARYDNMSSNIHQSADSAKMQEMITKIANPHTNATFTEQSHYAGVKNQLLQETQKGNPVAKGILSAVNHASESPADHAAKGSSAELPMVNRVQAINSEDYKAVENMWEENYKKLTLPKLPNGQESREDWIQKDVDNIEKAIELLSSNDPAKEKEGMDQVSKILPFLLIGGFSKKEVIAYLQAKSKAGKKVLADTQKESSEKHVLESTPIPVQEKKDDTMPLEENPVFNGDQENYNKNI